MRWLWGLAPLLSVALAQPLSDARRIHDGLGPGFQRPEVLIYPLIDQRRLSVKAQTDGRAGLLPVPPAWPHFVEALAAMPNLKVRRPAEAKRRLMRENLRGIELARRTLAAAYRDHREVRLEAALLGFDKATADLVEWGYDVIKPEELGRAFLTLGLAALESQQESRAKRAFERALTVDPAVRLRPGYDHPAAVAALEAARARLAASPPRPERFGRAGDGPSFVLRARALPDRLEIAIQTSGGVQFEEQALTNAPEDDASRLASRVYACLPFGRATHARRHRKRLYLDGGFSTLTFLESPVGAFYSMGVGGTLTWNIASNVGLAGSASLTNSDRDEAEDLRSDIPALLLFFGPGVYDRDGRLRLSAQVGAELAVLGEVITTTNPACKYFDPEDDIPKTLCDFDTDVNRTKMGVSVGVGSQLEAALRVVDEIYLALKLNAGMFIFESETNGLDYPIRVYMGLGYRLY